MFYHQVIWSRFFTDKSYDRGTLNQLKHLVHRTAVGANPKHNMKPTEDFLYVVLCAHIITAARQCKTSCDNTDNSAAVAHQIIKQFVCIKHCEESSSPLTNDSGFNYATDLLTMCLLWHGFHDSVKEGDGDRIILYWKVLLPIFQQSGHYNYAKEAFTLLAQTHILSERKITELKWSRTVNTTGRTGCNIPCDLHMEHLNRRLKYMMGNIAPNVNSKTIERVANSLGVVNNVCKNFEKEVDAGINKPYNSYPSFSKDLKKISDLLLQDEVFCVHEGRTLSKYDHQPFFASLKWKNISGWVKKKLLQLKVN